MKFSADFVRKTYPFSILLIFISAVLFWHFSPRAESAVNWEKPAELPNYDIRTDETTEARTAIGKFLNDAGKTESLISAERKKFVRAEQNLLSNGAKVKIEYSEDLRTPEIIAPDLTSNENLLTAPSSEKRAAILKNFLKRNSELVGLEEPQIDALETTADYTNPDGNLSFVHFEQKIGGIPVFRGEVKAGFSKRGEIIRIVNNLAPNLDYESLSKDFGSAEEAVSNAAKYINSEPISGKTTTEKIYFPVENGVAGTAWRVLLWTKTEAFYVIVDARDGTLLWRKNITESQTRPATFTVYGNSTSLLKTADSPTPFTPGCISPLNCPQPPIVSRQSFTLVGNEPPYTFNNLGWIPDNGLTGMPNQSDNITDGNAVEAGVDRVAPNGVDAPVPGNPNRVFSFNYNPAPGNPPPGEDPLLPEFQKGSVTHAFYTVNRWHDEMYLLGFTEQARNFQHFNFGRGGSEGDRVSAEIQDISATNGANMSVPADGNRPRLQMFIWTAGTPDRDGGLDSQVLVHELTHGLSSRLHGNSSGLSNNMSRAMGEGWSDFYALALLSEPTDDPLGTHAIAGYLTHEIIPGFPNYYYGIRRFPTAIRASLGANGLPHNPLTFKYLNAGCDTFIGTTTTNPNSAFPRNPAIAISGNCDQIHNAGEIWNVALWEVRHQLIQQHGATEGNRRILQYVTDGMKLSPLNPNMLQARDAIITAAFASDPNDGLPVRRGFAIRGMGFYASIQNAGTGANNAQVTESFEISANVFIGAGFSVSDSPGNNNGYPDPGEPLILTVPLSNNSGSAITDVIVQVGGGGSAAYGTIANGQTVSQNINFTLPGSAACGVEYTITFNITSSAGTRTETRTIIPGTPFGGPPVTVTNSTPLTIPSVGASTPYGTTVNVAGLSGNKKIKLELTGFSHTFPGDVDVLLVGPGGQKFIVMSDAVSSSAAQTNANIILKDNAVNLLPASGSVNMNGEWKPTNHTATGDNFPAPAPAAPYESPAPGGSATFASVFGPGGAAMNGTWTLYVVDDASGDGGSLAGWKLTFESNDYLCCFCPAAQKPEISTPSENSAAPVCSCAFPTARADFDGDSRSDISVFRPSEGNWYMNQSQNGFGVLNWGMNGDRLTPGDFDDDGRTDFAVFRPNADSSQPDFYVLRSFDFTFSGYSWGLPDDIPVIEDYDGDGKSDIAVFRPSNHTFYVLRSGNGSVLTYSNIESGIPAAGDFDGDGKGDFATYSVNGWYLSPSTANYATHSFTRWGAAGDKPVPADYDGDGKDDFAVFRPSDRTWYILKTGGGIDFVQFGLADDIPVPGDYDGDRKADIAVYRNGTWYINRSSAGILIAQFGLPSDIPIANSYLP